MRVDTYITEGLITVHFRENPKRSKKTDNQNRIERNLKIKIIKNKKIQKIQKFKKIPPKIRNLIRLF